MSHPSRNSGNVVWRFFASVKLSVAVLFILAAASVSGTFIPQGNPEEFYVHKYPLAGKYLVSLDIHHLYSSWLFRGLLILLCINIIVCSIDRLSKTWRIIFPGKKGVNPERMKKAKDVIRFESSIPKDEMIRAAETLLSSKATKPANKTDNAETFIFSESGRWTRLGVYIVHASVLLLLAGGLIGSTFGFRGIMNIPENEQAQEVMIDSRKPITIPFQIRCDDFDVSYYESGMPKEFRSKVTIIENGKEVQKRDIIVNSPLRYKGFSFFQSSYGVAGASDITLEIIAKNGEKHEKTVQIGDKIEIPGSSDQFMISGFEDTFQVRGHTLKEVFTCFMLEDGQPSDVFILPAGMPGFDKMRGKDFYINVKDYKKTWYTGLQVTKDPGVSLVYSGFLLMLAGCCISFFMAHRQFGIFVKGTDSGCEVTVCGVTSRKNPVFEDIIKNMAEKLGGSIRKQD